MRWLSRVLRFVPLLVLAGLAGCAAPPYARDRAVQQTLALSDAAEIQQRWGLLTSMIGQSWVITYTNGGGIARTARWVVPGAVMRFENLDCNKSRCHKDDWMLFYDPDTKSIALHCAWGPGTDNFEVGCADAFVRAVAQPDGSIKVVYTIFHTANQDTLTGDRDENTLYYLNGDRTRIGPYWRVVSQQVASRQIDGWRQLVADSDRESSEFWGNVGMAVVAGAQTYANERQAAAPAYTPPATSYVPSNSTQRSSASSHVPAASARSATQSASPSHQSRTVTPATQQSRTSSPANAQRTAGVTPTSSAASKRIATPTQVAQADSGPKRTATPEAIFVCTRPNAKGNFSCNSPVSVGIDSGPNGLSNERTPEQLVASYHNSCANPRRLQSATHLVWGCGFGATNLPGYMDRSAGVDVKGRRTYYCFEKESGCRRTTP